MQFLKGHGYEKTVYGLAFSPEGNELASCGLDQRVRLWDLTTGKQIDECETYHMAQSISYSRDGRFLAWPHHYEVRVRDQNDKTVSTYSAHDSYAYSTTVAFTTDLAILLCAWRSWRPRGTGLAILDRNTGKWTPWADSGDCTAALALSNNGHIVASAHQVRRPNATYTSSRQYDHSVRVWDFSTRRLHCTLTGPGSEITSLAFSPNGKHLAATSGIGLWVWDVTNQQAVAQLKFEKQHCKSVAFSPDGHWLALARNDSTVRFFDSQSWTEGPSFDWKIGPAVVVTFARDGMRAACGSSKGKIVVWDVDE